MGAEGRVSREINDAAGGFDHISTPQGTITVEDAASGKCVAGDAMTTVVRATGSESPQSSSCTGLDAVGPQQTGYAERDDELGLGPDLRGDEGVAQVEMIVVVVAEEHEIDAGKIVESHAWRGAAAARSRSK